MTNSFRARQALAIARLELRRAFFSKRAFWVWFLAFFPVLIFLGHVLEVRYRQQHWSGQAVTAAQIDTVVEGESPDAVRERLGEPIRRFRWRERRSRDEEPVQRERLQYSDGRRRADFVFQEDRLISRNIRPVVDFEEDKLIFAGVFQYFYLKLAIFFGCLGIFMNLFRGEMLDKTLHFWLLIPARRSVLLAGKYLAGLGASIVIFSAGVTLSFVTLLAAQYPAEARAYWDSGGAAHLGWYVAAAALACAGYGSVFLAAGLLLRNPIVPAVALLFWEGINGFLPAMLQKLSVLYYVQSLCPIPPPMDDDMPALARLLLAPAEPAPAWTAVLGVIGVTALVLWLASRAVNRLEINYSSD
ncbi:MAG: ABC transporter permease subunit [Bryobacteraceae bacterium]